MRQAVRVNGESIDDFIPNDLRHMFYKNADPLYKYQVTNGYAPYDFSTKDLLLYLPLWALKGSAFKSVDAYKHIATVTTATWKPNGRDFNSATPDYIELASETVMNFTSEDFSIIARIKIDDLTADNYIFIRGLFNDDGYRFTVDNTGKLILGTHQDLVSQNSYSDASEIVINTWYTVGMSRSGASAKVYGDGVDVTTTLGTHIDPETCARTAKIGVYDNKSGSPFDGIIQDVLVYNRALSEAEHLHTHNCLSWRE